MEIKLELFTILSILLLGSIGILTLDTVFEQDFVSNLWFMDGTAILTKIAIDTTSDEITIDLSETVVGITGN